MVARQLLILLSMKKPVDFIPRGSKILVFVEVQTGSYFGEDDIIRLEDDYLR